MYTVAVKRDFIAQHYLVGGDWGLENDLHSHHYAIELQLEGAELDQHGYLVDIVDIEKNLEALVDEYRDQTLNDLPAFKGLNPSIEHFSRILCLELNQPDSGCQYHNFYSYPLGKRDCLGLLLSRAEVNN